LDQFTYAERATDWRGNNNIAESIFRQMSGEPRPVPDWIVMSAGTGGTSATLGRYIRYRNLETRLCVVDVEGSAFYDAWHGGDMTTTGTGSRIEGIGRPRVEPSFMPDVIDRMIRIPDAASIAAARVLSERLFRRVGGSTGTNLMGVLCLAAQMLQQGRQGALVTVICDSGDRYEGTYFNDDWLRDQGIHIDGWTARIARFLDDGTGAFL
uniref:pyridoxal-phosphate dependent enzyme n=1 Tax=uncultured Paracoccus sp. TaxID=189685 RepID=UPI0025E255F4